MGTLRHALHGRMPAPHLWLPRPKPRWVCAEYVPNRFEAGGAAVGAPVGAPVASLASLPVLEAQELFAAAERTLVNQCVFIPMLYYPLFFVITALVRHLSPIEAWDFASKVYLPMLQRNLAFWIPIQFAQFALVPIDLQVLYACVAGVAWNIILSANAGKLSTSGSKDASEEDAVLAVERASNKGRLARSRG